MGARWDLSDSTRRKYFDEFVSQMQVAGKRPVVEFVDASKSDRQRGYQWGWVYRKACEALAEAGISIPLEDGNFYPYDSIILHEVLKVNVLRPLYAEWGRPIALKAKNGKALQFDVSTERDVYGKKITKKEFAEYVQKAKAWMIERWGIIITEPEDQYLAEYERELNRELSNG